MELRIPDLKFLKGFYPKLKIIARGDEIKVKGEEGLIKLILKKSYNLLLNTFLNLKN